MPDNFIKTAERMHDSGKQLDECGHYHNACYLAGYVGECYLKLIVGKIPNLNNPRNYGHKISDMERDIHFTLTSATNLGTLRAYLINMAVDCPNIHQWSPNKRYDDASGWDNPIASAAFQLEQEKCFDQIVAMYVDGVIS